MRSVGIVLICLVGGCSLFTAPHEVRVTITPYDSRIRSGGIVCTTEVRWLKHTATVVVTEVGDATVELRGRDGSAFRSVVIVPAT